MSYFLRAVFSLKDGVYWKNQYSLLTGATVLDGVDPESNHMAACNIQPELGLAHSCRRCLHYLPLRYGSGKNLGIWVGFKANAVEYDPDVRIFWVLGGVPERATLVKAKVR
jgi:hypothetical protein